MESDLCQKISNVISTYRDNEFGIYDADHVKKWISQFDEDEKILVLQETYKILQRNYITKESFNDFIDELFVYDGIHQDRQEDYWKTVSLLEIQQNGNSQQELNLILKEKILTSYQTKTIANTHSEQYIYLDDFIFTGNRLFNDLSEWINTKAPIKCRVCVITIGWYVLGQWQTENKLKEVVKQSGKGIELVFVSYTEHRLENRLSRKDYSHIFWPTNCIDGMASVTTYLNLMNHSFKYRVANGIKNEIFSQSRREQYEKTILKYGMKILSFSQNNNFVVKPLGYSTFRGLGFGSTVFSFRNPPVSE